MTNETYYVIETYKDGDFRDTWNEYCITKQDSIENAMREFIKGGKHHGELSLCERVRVKDLFDGSVKQNYDYPKYLPGYGLLEEHINEQKTTHNLRKKNHTVDSVKINFLDGPGQYGAKLMPFIELNVHYLLTQYDLEDLEAQEEFDDEIEFEEEVTNEHVINESFNPKEKDNFLGDNYAQFANMSSKSPELIIINNSVINRSTIGGNAQ